MRLMMVGALSKADVRDLKGQCCIVIAGSPDEIRSAAAFMYQEVEIKAAPEPCAVPKARTTQSEGEAGHALATL